MLDDLTIFYACERFLQVIPQYGFRAVEPRGIRHFRYESSTVDHTACAADAVLIPDCPEVAAAFKLGGLQAVVDVLAAETGAPYRPYGAARGVR